jgi:hypothetical protein
MPKTPEQVAALAYFHSMAGEMARMAVKQELLVMAHLFEMAEHEAAGVGDSKVVN